ncbi:hypothetical protein LSTR_LSTR015764 [Laodelphax striatellus]|uniref:Uncharacterized protein n=1 Tax=Laodelphax striatellus TaxID=195883 RepID=A0A482X003_LAOST|nr:hypothetical protein LSTR_LSTR015764 [Laodelphax striatellus]
MFAYLTYKGLCDIQQLSPAPQDVSLQVNAKHPDAKAIAGKQQAIQQQMRTLQKLATARQQRLMESMCRHEYLLESAELEQWIRDQMQAAGSDDYGQDYEHLLVTYIFT